MGEDEVEDYPVMKAKDESFESWDEQGIPKRLNRRHTREKRMSPRRQL